MTGTAELVADEVKDALTAEGVAAEVLAMDKLTPAEKEALSHAKSGGQDKRDAALLSDLEKKHKR